MQFQVPQFIETEDKIIGPLSLRQFIIVGVGFGFSALLYFILQTWLWLILSIVVLGAAGGIAFVKIEGRPLGKVILSALHFYWNPQTYVWQPEHPATGRAHPAAREREEAPIAPLRQKAASGDALHEHWEGLLTGTKVAPNQLTDRKRYGRYEIFQRITGDRQAARRVDYR